MNPFEKIKLTLAPTPEDPELKGCPKQVISIDLPTKPQHFIVPLYDYDLRKIPKEEAIEKTKATMFHDFLTGEYLGSFDTYEDAHNQMKMLFLAGEYSYVVPESE
jgi:hypothetical protein